MRSGVQSTDTARRPPSLAGDLELDSIRGLCVTVTCAPAVDFRRRPAIPNLIFHCAGSRWFPTGERERKGPRDWPPR
jgi:hypothetical protein